MAIDIPTWRRLVAQLRAGTADTDPGVEQVYGDASEGVFRVRADGRDYALKLAAVDPTSRESMARECHAAAVGASLDLAPTVIVPLPDDGALVTEFVRGEALTPVTLRDPATLARVADALRALHASTPLPWHQDLEGDLAYELASAEPQLPPALRAQLTSSCGRIWEALAKRPAPPCPCHNDVHTGNLFDNRGKIVLIDWAAAAMGDPAWDLAMLASAALFADADWSRLLGAYRAGPSFEPRARLLGVIGDVYNLAWYANYPDFDAGAAARYEQRLWELFGSRRIEAWIAALS